MPQLNDVFEDLDEMLYELLNPEYAKSKKRERKIDELLNIKNDEKSKVDNTK
jgi:hypothetical protein